MRSKFLNKKEDFKDEIDTKKINIKPNIIKPNTENINRAEQMCLKPISLILQPKDIKLMILKI